MRFTKSAAPNTWTTDTGLRVTSKRVKTHGKWSTLYTATKSPGTPQWSDVAEAHTLTALAVALAAVK